MNKRKTEHPTAEHDRLKVENQGLTTDLKREIGQAHILAEENDGLKRQLAEAQEAARNIQENSAESVKALRDALSEAQARIKELESRTEHPKPCVARPFGTSMMLKDGTKVCLERGENAHSAHVWLEVRDAEKVIAMEEESDTIYAVDLTKIVRDGGIFRALPGANLPTLPEGASHWTLNGVKVEQEQPDPDHVKKLVQENARLQQANANGQEQQQALWEKNRTLLAENERLRKEWAHLQGVFDITYDKNRTLRRHVAEADMAIKIVQEENKRLKEQVTASIANTNQAMEQWMKATALQERATLAAQLRESEEALSGVRKENNILRGQIESDARLVATEQALTEVQEESAALRDQWADAQAEIGRVYQELRQAFLPNGISSEVTIAGLAALAVERIRQLEKERDAAREGRDDANDTIDRAFTQLHVAFPDSPNDPRHLVGIAIHARDEINRLRAENERLRGVHNTAFERLWEAFLPNGLSRDITITALAVLAKNRIKHLEQGEHNGDIAYTILREAFPNPPSRIISLIGLARAAVMEIEDLRKENADLQKRMEDARALTRDAVNGWYRLQAWATSRPERGGAAAAGPDVVEITIAYAEKLEANFEAAQETTRAYAENLALLQEEHDAALNRLDQANEKKRRATAHITALYWALKEAEWGVSRNSVCAGCARQERDGHATDCKIGRALTKKAGQDLMREWAESRDILIGRYERQREMTQAAEAALAKQKERAKTGRIHAKQTNDRLREELKAARKVVEAAKAWDDTEIKMANYPTLDAGYAELCDEHERGGVAVRDAIREYRKTTSQTNNHKPQGEQSMPTPEMMQELTITAGPIRREEDAEPSSLTADAEMTPREAEIRKQMEEMIAGRPAATPEAPAPTEADARQAADGLRARWEELKAERAQQATEQTQQWPTPPKQEQPTGEWPITPETAPTGARVLVREGRYAQEGVIELNILEWATSGRYVLVEQRNKITYWSKTLPARGRLMERLPAPPIRADEKWAQETAARIAMHMLTTPAGVEALETLMRDKPGASATLNDLDERAKREAQRATGADQDDIIAFEAHGANRVDCFDQAIKRLEELKREAQQEEQRATGTGCDATHVGQAQSHLDQLGEDAAEKERVGDWAHDQEAANRNQGDAKC